MNAYTPPIRTPQIDRWADVDALDDGADGACCDLCAATPVRTELDGDHAGRGDLLAHIAQRLNSRLQREGDCWVWQGAKNDFGYGKMGVAGRIFYTHRIAYEIAKGPIPPGLHLDHLCRNTACANPAHLEAVTPSVNALRGRASALRDAPLSPHCGNGHSYAENERIDCRGRRRCRACDRDWQRAKRSRLARERLMAAEATCCDICSATAPVELIGGDRMCADCADKWCRGQQADDDLVPLDSPAMQQAIARYKEAVRETELRRIDKGLRAFNRGAGAVNREKLAALARIRGEG